MKRILVLIVIVISTVGCSYKEIDFNSEREKIEMIDDKLFYKNKSYTGIIVYRRFSGGLSKKIYYYLGDKEYQINYNSDSSIKSRIYYNYSGEGVTPKRGEFSFLTDNPFLTKRDDIILYDGIPITGHVYHETEDGFEKNLKYYICGKEVFFPIIIGNNKNLQGRFVGKISIKNDKQIYSDDRTFTGHVVYLFDEKELSNKRNKNSVFDFIKTVVSIFDGIVVQRTEYDINGNKKEIKNYDYETGDLIGKINDFSSFTLK